MNTILVVDDTEQLRRLYVHILAGHGYLCIEAVNAEEGLEKFKQNELDILAVLSDYEMPGKNNGIDLVRQIRNLCEHMPIVFGSGRIEHGGCPLAVHAISAGADKVLKKPFLPLELVSALHSAIERHRQFRATPQASA